MNIVVSELMWPEGLERLESFGNVTYDPELWRRPERLNDEVREAHALIVRNQTEVSASLLEAAVPSRRSAGWGVGLTVVC